MVLAVQDRRGRASRVRSADGAAMFDGLRMQGLLGCDRRELHVQSAIVVTDPEARDCAISGRADRRIRGGGSFLSQQARAQETGLPNSLTEPHDVLYAEKDFSVESVTSCRVLCSWPHLARPCSCAIWCDLVNRRAGHDVDFALGIPPTDQPTNE
jgi:hypothetical protein